MTTPSRYGISATVPPNGEVTVIIPKGTYLMEDGSTLHVVQQTITMKMGETVEVKTVRIVSRYERILDDWVGDE